MAKVRKNVMVRGVSGAFGGQMVLRHMRDGSTVMAKIQDFSHRKLSAEQKEHQGRFRLAVAYAKGAAQKHPLYAEIAAGTLKSAYNVALSDWLKPPVIHRVEREESRIRILATDNVMVARVQVTIWDEEGVISEKGEAVRAEAGWWEYVSSAKGKVEVEAWDLAGNRVSQVLG